MSKFRHYATSVAAIALALGLHAGQALATPVITSSTTSATFNLDQVPSTGTGGLSNPTLIGTVTLTQTSTSVVTVDVSLGGANTTGIFAFTGNPNSHTAFVFNLDSSASGATVAVTAPTVFAPLVGSSFTNTPFGTFTNGIDCGTCGPGTSGTQYNSLNFTVTDPGIKILDFVNQVSSGTGGGYYFSADVGYQSGAPGSTTFYTFNVASNSVASTTTTTDGGGNTSVPEPASVALLACGLLGLALVRARPCRQ